MKIFVFEYVTGGGYAGQALPEFLADGELMWRALVDDLIAVPGVEVLTLRDARLATPQQPDLHCVSAAADILAQAYRRCVLAADAVWLIAPETGGILENLNRDVLAADKTLLGCRPEAVQIAASKSATAACLDAAGIATVTTAISLDQLAGRSDRRVVVKPDDGVGCQDSLLFADTAAARAWQRQNGAVDCVFQPYLAGDALSLSLLCCAGRAQLLSVNRQHVSLEPGPHGERFQFHGVSVNALPDPDDRYAALAAQVARAIPGLWGYVGVDLIAAADGLHVLEVNPRVTASYAGLHAALNCNPAQRVLTLPEMRPCRGVRAVTVETGHA